MFGRVNAVQQRERRSDSGWALRTRRGLFVRAVIALVLGCGAAVMIAGRDFSLPPPTGPYRVGTTTVTLVRAATTVDPPGRYVAQLWYPAESSASPARYGDAPKGLMRFVYSRLIRTAATRDAVVAQTQDRFPLLLYVPGWGGQRGDNTSLAEDLASHGFVVAGLADAIHDSPPLRRFGAPMNLSSEQGYRSTLRLGVERADYQSRRSSEVLDELLGPHTPLTQGLAGRLDPNRVGIFGYSFGGAVALASTLRDPRFKAAMNLDGWLFNDARTPPRVPAAPYLLIGSDDPPVTEADLSADEPVRRYTARLNLADDKEQREHLARGGGIYVRVTGTVHSSFSDDPMYALTHRVHGAIDPPRMAKIVGEYALAFFEETLDGRRSPKLELQAPRDPAVKFERWPRAVTVRVAPS